MKCIRDNNYIYPNYASSMKLYVIDIVPSGVEPSTNLALLMLILSNVGTYSPLIKILPNNSSILDIHYNHIFTAPNKIRIFTISGNKINTWARIVLSRFPLHDCRMISYDECRYYIHCTDAETYSKCLKSPFKEKVHDGSRSIVSSLIKLNSDIMRHSPFPSILVNDCMHLIEEFNRNNP